MEQAQHVCSCDFLEQKFIALHIERMTEVHLKLMRDAQWMKTPAIEWIMSYSLDFFNSFLSVGQGKFLASTFSDAKLFRALWHFWPYVQIILLHEDSLRYHPNIFRSVKVPSLPFFKIDSFSYDQRLNHLNRNEGKKGSNYLVVTVLFNDSLFICITYHTLNTSTAHLWSSPLYQLGWFWSGH